MIEAGVFVTRSKELSDAVSFEILQISESKFSHDWKTHDQFRSLFVIMYFLEREFLLFFQDPSLFDQKRKWLIERLTYKRPTWKDEVDKIDSSQQR